ncbi:MAG: PH domain-containing protein [Minisyncoccia bacterium]
MITLFKDEEIILIQRRHWLPFFSKSISLLFLAILPFIIFALSQALPQNIQIIFLNYSNYYFFFTFSLIFILWLIFVVLWTNYYLDFILITNKRIIDVEQFNLFKRDESELRFEDVEDIKVEISGIIPSLFKFGNINIQSAGETREIILKNIPDPYKIKDLVAHQIEKNKELKK